MRFTPRMRQIFQVLLKEPSAISVRQLAEQMDRAEGIGVYQHAAE